MLTLVMRLGLCVPAFAVDTNSAHSIAAAKLDILQQRADQAQAQAIGTLPAALIQTNDDADQLTAALGSAFGVAVSSSTASTRYEYEFEEVLSVRFVYVYLAAEDRYSCTFITQSDSIVYSHRAFGKGWVSANPVKAEGIYDTSPFNRAISNFNSGSGISEIDHYKTFTAQIKYKDGSKDQLAQFVPIYVNSLTMVHSVLWRIYEKTFFQHIFGRYSCSRFRLHPV